jgi:hypothetical protein
VFGRLILNKNQYLVFAIFHAARLLLLCRLFVESSDCIPAGDFGSAFYGSVNRRKSI